MSKKTASLLWQIQSGDRDFYAYILGTMHVKDSRVFGIVERSIPYLESCTLFCAEYDLSSFEKPSADLMLRLQSVPNLDVLLGDKYYQKLKKVLLKRLNLDLDLYKHIHPMMLMSLIQRQSLGEEQSVILDATLWNHAGEKEIERRGVETVESQMLTILELPIEWHLATLKGMARNFSKFRKKTEKLLLAYENEDLTAIHRASRKMDGQAKRILSINRNIQMANFISAEANIQPAFFAIGAAHLLGEKGVLRLLKKQGFSVRPVK